VSYVTNSNTLQYRDYEVASSTWTEYGYSEPEDGAHYVEDDTAWLYDTNVDGFGKHIMAYRFKDSNQVLKLMTATMHKRIGGRSIADISDSGFYNISGMWKCPIKNKRYTLTTENLNIWGFGSGGQKTLLYTANRGSSIQRRISMFNVPAK
jgi:hypothetical protein